MKKGIIYVYFNKAKYEKEGVEKYYVGQTVGTMEQRAGKDGRRYGWYDLNYNSKFANSIRKWGWDSFEGRVLEEVYEEDLNELEKFYIEYFDSFKNGYNTTLGGEGTRGHNPYANKTEEEMKEIKEKMSKSQSIGQKKRFQDSKEREKISVAKRKCWEDEEYREKQKIALKKLWEDKEYREKQRKHWEDKEYREKQSISQKKRWEDKEYREKQSIVQRKLWEDKEYREKQSIVRRKRWKDQERRKKQSEKMSIISKKRFQDKSERKKCSQPGESNPRAKKVYCKELNIVFSYAKLAEKYCKNVLNSKISKIGAVCSGEAKSTGVYNGKKLHWNWLENVDEETLNNAEYIDSKKYEEIINAKINN